MKLELSKAFTLIELLVVIAIIGVLMAAATVSYVNAQQKGRDNKRKSDLKGVQQALELYYQQYGSYPNVSGAGRIRCNITGDTNERNWGNEFYCDGTGTPDPPRVSFMNPLPKEPVSTSSTPYYYFSSSPFNYYVLSTFLENTKDSELPQQSGCQSGYNYCVKNP